MRIRDEGPLTFSQFMNAALYDPEWGYYSSGAVRTGWGGHFLTSPQLDPAFGRLWARGLEGFHRALGEPGSLEVAEIGPAEGAFAAALWDGLDPSLKAVFSYRLVERVPAVRDRQAKLLSHLTDRVSWVESVADLPPATHRIVLANEVLDNLPVDVLEVREGVFREVLIGQRNGALIEILGSEVPEPYGLDARSLRDGHRVEIRPSAPGLLKGATESFERGAVVLIDYGYVREEIPRRPRGTLVCYSGTGADEEPLVNPGTKDITAHVDWTSVSRELTRLGIRVEGPHPQRDVLRALGALDLDDALEREHAGALAEGRGADAVASLSGRHALRALLDPGGLGGLDVLFAFKEMRTPSFATDL